jgi:hypothetical protein
MKSQTAATQAHGSRGDEDKLTAALFEQRDGPRYRLDLRGVELAVASRHDAGA